MAERSHARGAGDRGSAVPAGPRSAALTRARKQPAWRGHIEAVVNGVLHGWFHGGAGARAIRLEADGAALGGAVADLFRHDLQAALGGDGRYGFRFALPDALCDGADHVFTLRGEGGAGEISRSLSVARPATPVEGRVERLPYGEAEGWVWDRSRPGARLTVEAFEGDERVGAALAEGPREDLQRAGIGDGAHGFRLSLPPELFNRTAPRTLVFRADGVEIARMRPAAVTAPGAPVVCSAVTRAALAALRPFGAGLFLQAAPADMTAALLAHDDEGARVTLGWPQGRVALLRSAPGAAAMTQNDWLFEVAFENRGGATEFAAELVEFSTDARFEPLLSLGAPMRFGPGPHKAGFTVSAQRLRSRGIDLSERPLFLALATEAGFDLAGLRIGFSPTEAAPETVPLRACAIPLFRRIEALNSAISRADDLDALALEAGEAALPFEAHETAAALAARIRPEALKADQIERWLRLFADTAIAQGRYDEARAKLLDHWPLTRRDDGLFAAFSACFPPAPELRGFLGALPSGRPNLFWLAALPPGGEPPAVEDEAERDLLAVHAARRATPEAYGAAWTRYLARFKLEGVSAARLGDSGVPASLRFEPPAAYEDGPLVSVIMAAYKASPTILASVASILEQSHRNLELLICDDASPDDTLEKLRVLDDSPRIRLFRSRANQGPYNIRNNLLREARGEFVTFHDADDIAHPARIARQLAEAQRTGRDFTLGGWLRLRPDGGVVYFRDQKALRLALVSLFARRGAIERFGGFRQVLCGGDSELAQRIKPAGVDRHYSERVEPLIFGLWSAQSLTRSAGLEAREDGLLSPARRAYSEAAARRHLLGEELAPGEAIDEINRRHGIFRADAGVEPVRD